MIKLRDLLQNYEEYFTIYALYSIITIIVFRSIFFNEGVPGHSTDWAIPETNFLFKIYHYQNMYVWLDNFLGIYRGWYIYDIIYRFIGSYPSVLGISGATTIKFWIYMTSILTSIFFYIFSKSIIQFFYKENGININVRITAFVVGLFAGLGLMRYGMTVLGQFFSIQFTVVFVPIALYYFIKYISFPDKRNFLILTLFLSIIFTGYPQMAVLLAILFGFIILIYVIFDKRFLKSLLIHIVMGLPIFILLSAYFIFPTIYKFDYVSQQPTIMTNIENLFQNRNYYQHFPLYYSITGAEWAYRVFLFHIPENIFGVWYLTLLLYMLAFIFFPFFILRRYWTRLNISIVMGSYLTMLFAIGYIWGIDGPLVPFLEYSLHWPIFKQFYLFFRSIGNFIFLLHFIYTIFLSISIYYVISHAKKRYLIFILIFVVIFEYPLLSQYYLVSNQQEQIDKNAMYLDIYNDNPELLDFYKMIINDEEDYRVLIVPGVKRGTYLDTNFQNYNSQGDDPMIYNVPKQALIETRKISKYNSFFYEDIKKFVKMLNNGDRNSFEFMQFFGVRYVVLRKDIVWKEFDVEKIDKFLEQNDDKAKLVFNGDYVKVFELDTYKSKFFSVSDIGQYNEDQYLTLDELIKDSNNLSTDIRSYEKINPTKYTVSIATDSPILLAFVETYDPFWIARTDDNTYGSAPLYSINSFQINETGNLNITVEYSLQKYFYYGLIISLSTFVLLIAYITLTIYEDLVEA